MYKHIYVYMYKHTHTHIYNILHKLIISQLTSFDSLFQL